MTKTLTTERLREIVEHRSPSLRWGEAEKIAAELLANREAQPVGYAENGKGFIYHPEHRDRIQNPVAVYTAPPAPVVNPEFTGATAVPDGYCIMPLTLTAANGAKGALSGEFKISRTVRCHECGGEGCDDCADAGEFEEEITVPWDTIKDIYRAAVEACRAAMLAQPVSQGCKLPEGFKLMPIEITDEIAEAIALEARCCGGIALCIYEAALAAAPEGGNG